MIVDLKLDSLVLPSELIWQDEMEWTTVRASTKRTVQGKNIIRENSVPSESGRPITLISDYAWISRSDVLTLQSWESVIGKQMALQMHDGRLYVVRFRHWDLPAMNAELVYPNAYPTSTTQYNLMLKLSVI